MTMVERQRTCAVCASELNDGGVKAEIIIDEITRPVLTCLNCDPFKHPESHSKGSN